MSEINSVEQDIYIEGEMENIVLAGMISCEELKSKIVTLCGLYKIESTSPTPLDIAMDIQRLTMEYGKGTMEDATRDAQLKSILSKALTASDPLSIPMS